jgi:glycosyltransferase involved in cell wall biosynthesis
MKIAIVAPSPIPFMVGGAEKLWQGFYKYLSESTSHQVDLIKVPIREHSLTDLVASYVKFSELDLSGFDVVITTKYPAWAINHPRHIVYLQHRLRGLYDTYNGELGITYTGSDARVLALQDFMQANADNPAAFGEFVERFQKMAATSGLDSNALAFPGPFARSVVHFMDSLALHPDRIERYAAISHEVKNRADYFPAGAHVDVIHHPTSLSLNFIPKTNTVDQSNETPYLFLASRLDAPKRHALLIEAMGVVRSNVRLKIAGTGPLESELKTQATNSTNIEFLGFVSDTEIAHHYQSAFAVPFFPLLEDYGLISLEAMLAGKPVITTTDSGGTNELVEDGVNGYITAPNAKAVADAIDQLAADPKAASRMGESGLAKAQEITWERLLARLIPQAAPGSPHAKAARKRITVAVTYPIYPPRGGGQSRVFNLYREIAKQCDVDIVTLTEPNHEAYSARIGPTFASSLTERRFPITHEHFEEENKLRKSSNFLQLTDIALITLYKYTPAFCEALEQSITRSDIVIASHPFCLPAILDSMKNPQQSLLGYEAHNLEYLLKKSMLPDNPGAQALVQQTKTVERQCIELSQFVLTCSDEDTDNFRKIYNCPNEKFIWAPNGVDTKEVEFVDIKTRQQRKRDAGLSTNQPVALFIGSWHLPNLHAVAVIERCARTMPDIAFLVAGSIGMAPRTVAPPDNMRFLGVVDDAQRLALLAMADIALNPMLAGSGTNLKMLDYLAAGIPVVSTETGARGLGLTANHHYQIADADQFEVGILDALKQDWSQQVVDSRKHIETKFDWQIIAENVMRDWRKIGVM